MRKRNKVTKALAVLLASVMCLTACSAPGGSESTEGTKEQEQTQATTEGTTEGGETSTEAESVGITYPLEGNPTFTIAIQERAAVVSQFPDYDDVPWLKAWQEATGVTLKIDQYPSTQAMNLMYASGELPDIILFHWASYSGGIAKAVKDKVVMPITDYMEFAPDLQAVMDEYDEFRKGNTTAEGEIIGFPQATLDEYLLKINGIVVRQEYLDQVKMDVPNTLDEMYAVLKAFKDELNIEIPLGLTSAQVQTLINSGLWTTPFGFVQGGEYVLDGKIQYGYYHNFEAYKEVVEFFKKLYDEKILDNNFSVGPDTAANFMNGISGMTYMAGASGLNKVLQTMGDDPNFTFTAIPSLVSKDGETPLSGQRGTGMGSYYAVITPKCKDVEAAMKFLNYGYTEEGHMLFNFGVEGKSYEMVDGYPKYTEYITKNPDGLTMQQAMVPYVPLAQAGAGALQDVRYFEQYAGSPEQQEALNIWNKNTAEKYAVPSTVTVSSENLSEYTGLNGDITTYVNETLIKCISGLMSMEDFEKEFISTLEKMGMKRYIEIRQASYDEWLDR